MYTSPGLLPHIIIKFLTDIRFITLQAMAQKELNFGREADYTSDHII